jgi:DNA-binding protein H-NS
MNLSSLSLPELTKLQKALPAAIKRRRANERKSIIIEVRALVAQRGFDFDELLNGIVTSQELSKKPVKPLPIIKYRHPQDSSLQWTGRGRKPAWVIRWEADGNALSMLEV